MLSIVDLCEKFSVTRAQIYVRRKKLSTLGIDVEFVKQGGMSYASEDLVKALTQQDNWLKEGGTLDNFTLAVVPEVVTEGNNTIRQQDKAVRQQYKTTIQDNNTRASQYVLVTTDQIQEIAVAVASVVSQPDPLAYIDRLRTFAEFGVEITTKEVKGLIGVRPYGDNYERGSFKFVKVGKIGNQSAWRVFFQKKAITTA